MSDERQITSDDAPAGGTGAGERTGDQAATTDPGVRDARGDDAADATGGDVADTSGHDADDSRGPGDGSGSGSGEQDADRIERLRALLTAPIKIPESESGESAGPAAGDGDSQGERSAEEDEYPAPSVDIPPHVRAAAEAAAHAGADEPRRTRTGKKRRTWADAFLDTGRRDLSGSEDAATQLLTRLDELDRRTGQDVAHTRARADEAAETAQEAQRALESVRAEAAGARQGADDAAVRLGTLAEQTATATEDVASLRTTVTDQAERITRLTASLDAAAQTADESAKAAAAARDDAAAAARRAGTALVVAVVGIVVALAAIGVGFAL